MTRRLVPAVSDLNRTKRLFGTSRLFVCPRLTGSSSRFVCLLFMFSRIKHETICVNKQARICASVWLFSGLETNYTSYKDGAVPFHCFFRRALKNGQSRRNFFQTPDERRIQTSQFWPGLKLNKLGIILLPSDMSEMRPGITNRRWFKPARKSTEFNITEFIKLSCRRLTCISPSASRRRTTIRI